MGDVTSYDAFLASKRKAHRSVGFDPSEMPGYLFDWQADVTRWALRKGRACLFEACGLGKTVQQLAWADAVAKNAGGPVLILAPLAVADQTAAEAERFGIEAAVSSDGSVVASVTVTNYEKLHRFDVSEFAGIVLDESSILKSHDGKTRGAILDAAASVHYRLACTATPAPNDVIELANHAEFVGACTRGEMLATWFVHDGGSTQDWRIKGHAEAEFWRWVATWAVMLRTPADIGADAAGYDLPRLITITHVCETEPDKGQLFTLAARSLTDQRAARKKTMRDRVKAIADQVNASDEQWVVWAELNAEADALTEAINGARQVAGSTRDDDKRKRFAEFASGELRVLVSKPKIAGFGLNWQHCARMAFVGLSHSWEQYHQAVRRCWRFGQTREVEVHVATSDLEQGVVDNIMAKQAMADAMAESMVGHMGETMRDEIKNAGRPAAKAYQTYQTDIREGPGWRVALGDSVDYWQSIDEGSVDYTVFSPPFASLYTYSDSDRDMGNCTNGEEFAAHFAHLVPLLLRATKPGRLLSFHCMNLPTSKARDGYIGISDFRGELIRMFTAAGWIYHSEVVIWKDPVTAMQRTKALGLLHKTIRKDSAMSRQGIPDYLVTMRKPGDNPDPVSHTAETFPVQMWQRYASPVWMDINPSDTLQKSSAREERDERHICPLQLGVIRRAITLWSSPGDLVASPFTGIGSEGYVALQMGRRFVGCELKRSYWEQACANLASGEVRQMGLFDDIADPEEAALWEANV